MKFVSSLLILLITPAAFSFTVAIDPGHGGSERGASHNKIEESKINMIFSKALQSERKKKNIKSFLTRTEDVTTSLESRMNMVNSRSADLFISVHANSHSSPGINGLEIYFQNELPPDKRSLFLAHQEHLNKEDTVDWPLLKPKNIKELEPEVLSILQDLQRTHQVTNNSKFGVLMYKTFKKETDIKVSLRQAPLYVVRNTQCPSILIELGYLTNKKEVAKLLSSSYQKTIVQTITKAITSYKNN